MVDLTGGGKSMEIGADLRNARVARKRSIEEIARITKITPALLRAIENDAFDQVPRGLFTRGYIRAYAREVGLDGEALVQRYRAEFEPVTPVPEIQQPPPAELERERLGWVRRVVPADDDESTRTRKVIIQLCFVLLAITVYFVGWKRPATVSTSEPKPTATLGVAAGDTHVPAVQPAVATAGASEPPRTHTIEIHPRSECWVEATVDNERVIARVMKDGDRQSLPIRGEVRIRVGDPGAFAFAVDGVAGRSIGRPREPVTVHINEKNYREYIGHSPQ